MLHTLSELSNISHQKEVYQEREHFWFFSRKFFALYVTCYFFFFILIWNALHVLQHLLHMETRSMRGNKCLVNSSCFFVLSCYLNSLFNYINMIRRVHTYSAQMNDLCAIIYMYQMPAFHLVSVEIRISLLHILLTQNKLQSLSW